MAALFEPKKNNSIAILQKSIEEKDGRIRFLYDEIGKLYFRQYRARSIPAASSSPISISISRIAVCVSFMKRATKSARTVSGRIFWSMRTAVRAARNSLIPMMLTLLQLSIRRNL